MNQLVFIENNQVLTDSLVIAQTFNKSHDNVLRDIKNLECSNEFSLRNFEESTYINDRGRTYPKYLITQDGFSFLVMGYTGKEAARFKEMYINEFNRMKDELNKPSDLAKMLLNPDTIIKIAQNWKQEQQLRLAAESKIEQDKPKVIFADAVTASKTSILIGELAKLLKQNGVDTGQQRLFKWMRNNGFLIKRQGTDYNMPTQRSMELGLFEIKETSVSHSDGHITINKTPKVTGKGQVYFINKFKEVSACEMVSRFKS